MRIEVYYRLKDNGPLIMRSCNAGSTLSWARFEIKSIAYQPTDKFSDIDDTWDLINHPDGFDRVTEAWAKDFADLESQKVLSQQTGMYIRSTKGSLTNNDSMGGNMAPGKRKSVVVRVRDHIRGEEWSAYSAEDEVLKTEEYTHQREAEKDAAHRADQKKWKEAAEKKDLWYSVFSAD